MNSNSIAPIVTGALAETSVHRSGLMLVIARSVPPDAYTSHSIFFCARGTPRE